MFSTGLDNFLPFLSNLKLSSAKSFDSEESKICHLVMGYTIHMYRTVFSQDMYKVIMSVED